MILTTTVPILGRTKDDGKRKPAIYKRYDYGKCGVDIVDQHFAQKTVRMKSNRWTTNVCKYFFNMLKFLQELVSFLEINKIKQSKMKTTYSWFFQNIHLNGLYGYEFAKIKITLGSFIVSLFRVLHHGHSQSELLDFAKSSRGTYLHKVIRASFFH